MPLIIRDLPSITFTTSGTTSPAWGDLDDATSIAILSGATTGNNLTIQVALSSISTAAFSPLLVNSSGGAATVVSSSGIIQITSIGFRQINFTSTVAPNAAITISGTKQISV